MNAERPPSSPLLVSIALGMLAAFGCTREAPKHEVAVGKPVVDVLGVPRPFSYVEIASRPPGFPAWNARIRREVDGSWRFISRSDGAGLPGDLADARLVEHFLEITSTFTTDEAAPKGNDASFGFNPYRLEIRVGTPITEVLQLGEPTGVNGVYFRIGSTGRPWIGRGALITFLSSLQTPEALALKSPFRAPLDEIASVKLAKVEGKQRGSWEFSRSAGQWMQGEKSLTEEKELVIERVFRQRLIQVLPVKELPDLNRPDWKLTVRTARGEETLDLIFSLNNVFAKNPARADRALELYPEMAGALRAFTQARFTPRKSGTK